MKVIVIKFYFAAILLTICQAHHDDHHMKKKMMQHAQMQHVPMGGHEGIVGGGVGFSAGIGGHVGGGLGVQKIDIGEKLAVGVGLIRGLLELLRGLPGGRPPLMGYPPSPWSPQQGPYPMGPYPEMMQPPMMPMHPFDIGG